MAAWRSLDRLSGSQRTMGRFYSVLTVTDINVIVMTATDITRRRR